MSTNSTITPNHYRVLKITAALVYLLIVLGGLVCITDASSACPDWPGCFGKAIPPLEAGAITEWTHRVVAMFTGFFLIASLVLGWRNTPEIKPLKWLPVVAILLTIVVSWFGARAVLYGLSPILAAFDLGFALLIFALTLITTLVAKEHLENPGGPVRFTLKPPLARLSFLTTLLAFITLDMAVLVAEGGSVIRCVGWPMYFGQLAPANLSGAPQITRLTFAAIASLLILYLFTQVRKQYKPSTLTRRFGNFMGLFFLIELVIGATMIAIGYEVLLLVIFVAAAIALWGALVALTATLGLSGSN